MKIHICVALTVIMGILPSIAPMRAEPSLAMNNNATELDQRNDEAERATVKSDKGSAEIPIEQKRVDKEGRGVSEAKILEPMDKKAAENAEGSVTNGSGEAVQPDKEGLKLDKDVSPKSSDGDKALKKDRPLDRRWIIKQRDKDKIKTQKKDREPIKWKDMKQKSRCESYSAQLKQSFLRARYYSIQGDHCSTAEHAKTFLGLVGTCQRDCPQGFLGKCGYDDRIIRNLNLLYKLGTEQCLK